jgi:hypothetical protein
VVRGVGEQVHEKCVKSFKKLSAPYSYFAAWDMLGG